ncbi:hypothetical protein L7F22_012668 [Adiantum nelumboides]|nr:hypothetical protein [Adiantum nelumboides]
MPLLVGADMVMHSQVVPDEDAFGTEVVNSDRLARIVHVWSAFGSLMFDLLVLRPNLAYAIGAFAVGVVSRAMTDTSIVHSGALQICSSHQLQLMVISTHSSHPFSLASTKLLIPFQLLFMMSVMLMGTIMQGIRGDGYFEDGLYVIAAGGNDFINALIADPNITHALGTLRNQLPAMVNRTLEVVQDLYAEGARRFFIKNVPPVGCNPSTLTILASPYVEYDMLGCIRSVNNLAQSYGLLLQNAINTLRLWHPDGLFIYGDYFGVIYDMLQRHSSFGFNQTTQNCCGVGGYYNFNFMVRCGQSGELNGQPVEARPCSNPSTYMFWDGIHFTEAANRVIAQQFLRGLYLDPSNGLHSLCQFDMSVVNNKQ